jgi:radical SAM-linked protein
MIKMRAEITKGEELRYISHLDYMAAIGRAIRRSKLPAAYSEGFNPHLKMAFSSALGLGVTSDSEYMDIEFKEEISPKEVMEKLKPLLPRGIDLKRVKVLHGKQKALMAIVDLAVYEIDAPFCGDEKAARAAIAAFNEKGEVTIIRRSLKKGEKAIECKKYLEGPALLDIDAAKGKMTIHLSLKMTGEGSVKASEILKALADDFSLPVNIGEAFINRRAVFAAGKNPMDL